MATLTGCTAGQARERDRRRVVTDRRNLEIAEIWGGRGIREAVAQNDQVSVITAEAGHAVNDPDAVGAIAVIGEEVCEIRFDLARQARAHGTVRGIGTVESCARCCCTVDRYAETDD